MDLDRLRSRADTLRSLHVPGRPLLLVNAWDAATAIAVARAGAKAIATTSAGVSWSLGYADGERVPRDLTLAAAARVAAAVDLPVSADLEAGFGDVAETVRLALEAGIVGMNLEDAHPEGAGDRLFSVDEAASRVKAARRAADAAGVPFVINARTDIYFKNIGDERKRFDATVERANAYLAAGADCAFVPFVRDAATIGALVKAIKGPVNVLAVSGMPDLPELAKLGVARVSLGSSPIRVMLAMLAARSRAAFVTGRLGPLVDEGVPYQELQGWMDGD